MEQAKEATQQSHCSNKADQWKIFDPATAPPGAHALYCEIRKAKASLEVARAHLAKVRIWAEKLEADIVRGLNAARQMKEELQDRDAEEPAEVVDDASPE